ncbi:hypothetical protein [Reichenbachiella sp.]
MWKSIQPLLVLSQRDAFGMTNKSLSSFRHPWLVGDNSNKDE